MEQMCGMSDHNNEIQFTANLRFTVGLQYLLKISYVNFDKGIEINFLPPLQKDKVSAAFYIPPCQTGFHYHNRFSKIYILNRKNWIEFSIQSKLL